MKGNIRCYFGESHYYFGEKYFVLVVILVKTAGC